jgi:putative transposase
VLKVSRSQLTLRLQQGLKPRTHYRKSEDAELLPPLRALVNERPTYGYRRIGALMNRERLKSGLPGLNHKRIYRLMSQHALLLQRCTGKPPTRAHEGKIVTIRPNAGLRTASRSPAGTERYCGWPSRSTPAIGSSWPGARVPPASAAR